MRKQLLAITLTLLVLIPAKAQLLVMSGSLEKADPALLSNLQEQLRQADYVVVLGDFLDAKTLRHYRRGSELTGISLLKENAHKVLWVPGRSEWGAIRGNAYDNLELLKDQLQEIDTSWYLTPTNACPGPEVVEVSAGVTLVVVNSNWWLHEGEKPSAAECGLEDPTGFYIELESILQQYSHTKTFLISYHPLKSSGPHGGYFPASTHFLPPVLGSLYYAYRKQIGGRHDLTNYFYESLLDDFAEVLLESPDVTVISALENSFQYNSAGIIPQLIVGDLSRESYVKKMDGLIASSTKGFITIDASQNAPTATFHSQDERIDMSLRANVAPESDQEQAKKKFPETVVAQATDKLVRNQKKPGLLGKNYRAEWAAELSNIPVFDLDKEKGGLEIIKQGGGQQTRSLRLEAADERQYVLRSIEKYPEKAVPAELRNTIAADVIADQISASHPYAAFVIPPLADAAGVYHTNPRLVYLPDDPRLGKFREQFGDGLYLFEERPDDDWRDLDSFGNSKKIMSTSDVIEKLGNDGDHIIDQEQTVRSRLFDIWIGDWDRHDDQWRWARFKPENEHDLKYYQPIPRDRDQAFFWSDGSLLKLSSRRWGQPKFQGFNEEIRDVAGLEFNARHFDRTFLTGAERTLWIKTAQDLKERLSDSVIEEAVAGFPPEIFALHGDEIIEKLKSRRENMVRYAEDYYLFLSKTVTITCSDKEDYVEIVRKPEGSVFIEVWRMNGETGEKKYRYYHRTFLPEETKEIRLFALGDDDLVEISGESEGGPLIRVIGGKGEDIIRDGSKVSGWRKKTVVYDKPDVEIQSAGEVRKKLSTRDAVNRYNRYDFKFNTTMPVVNGGFNPDDGVFVGGGIIVTRHGFRKDPYKVRHQFMASLAPVSGSYNISYNGHFVELLGKWDLRLAVDIFEPSYADFFYGLGNKTNFNEDLREADRQFYRVRYRQWIFKPMLSRTSADGKHRVTFGPTYRSVEIEEDENEDGDRFISLYADFVGRGSDAEIPLLETTRDYIGLELNYQLDLRDRSNFPLEGMFFDLEMATIKQVGQEENNYQRFSSALSFYSTFGGALRTTVALRAGGQVNFGEYEFYQAARIGGSNNLRGYRKFRFAGEQAFYTNVELRTKLIQFNSFLFPAEAGLLFFHDLGRVWESNPEEPIVNPDKASWHRGIGAGIWIAPLGRTVISADYGISNDDEQAFFVRFGFMF